MSERTPSAFPWVFVLTFSVLYALWPHLGLPAPFYLPETRGIVWSKPSGVIAMGWYGRLLTALLVSFPIAAVGAAAVRRGPKRLSGWGGWMSATVVIIALIAIAIEELNHWVLGV